MIFYLLICFTLTVGQITRLPRSAVVHLISEEVTGSITFTETEEGIHVKGTISGLDAGNYGFHIHELGDTIDCDAAGSHFNPYDTDHGGRDHTVRHVGDLGNIQFVGTGTGVAEVDFVDKVIALRGRNNILGRALILHGQEDDLGLGGHETSLTTGNAGSRVVCAVIGVGSPVDAWV
ncbi:uncharacterized protein LOC131846803 [Achroia grisella]|uniref:uncharacterized protein LOC131846803 n=1 Tax=Achroia grisella TaxID=688607 RepID=UPI0027D3451F|nr:uncharacterized protein LOC131846803 [Achroia grisella]